MHHYFLILFLFVNTHVKYLDAFSYYELLQATPDAVLIDVREIEFYMEQRIPNAFCASERARLDVLIDGLDRKTPIFLYCTKGLRSKDVVTILKRERFRNIYVLESGFNEWMEQGLPIDSTILSPEEIAY
jgi:phage shock protein E